MSYFSPCSYSKNEIEVELDLSNYATKPELRKTTGADTSQCTEKDDLANLKSEVDKLYIDQLSELDPDKLKPVAVDLSKLSDAVKSDVVEKDVCNTKIKNIEDKIPDITNLATNTTLNPKINEVKNKIPSITNLATNASLNAKTNEVKGEIPSITNLATTAAFTTVENKILNVSELVKKRRL